MTEPRFYVEERSGIAAIYDTHHPQYHETAGCHADYPWVVGHWSGYQVTGEAGVHWTLEPRWSAKAHETCALLNELHDAAANAQAAIDAAESEGHNYALKETMPLLRRMYHAAEDEKNSAIARLQALQKEYDELYHQYLLAEAKLEGKVLVDSTREDAAAVRVDEATVAMNDLYNAVLYEAPDIEGLHDAMKHVRRVREGTPVFDALNRRLKEAAADNAELRQWKSEAVEVLNDLDRLREVCGDDIALGRSIVQGAIDLIQSLRAALGHTKARELKLEFKIEDKRDLHEERELDRLRRIAENENLRVQLAAARETTLVEVSRFLDTSMENWEGPEGPLDDMLAWLGEQMDIYDKPEEKKGDV